MPFPRIDREALETTFQESDVISIIGAPERPLALIWRSAQMLFRNHDIPLAYETTRSNQYTDERGQSVYEQEAVSVLAAAIESVNLNHTTGKKLCCLLDCDCLISPTELKYSCLIGKIFSSPEGWRSLPEVIATLSLPKSVDKRSNESSDAPTTGKSCIKQTSGWQHSVCDLP